MTNGVCNKHRRLACVQCTEEALHEALGNPKNKLRLKCLKQELCDVLYQLHDDELVGVLLARPLERDRLKRLLGVAAALDKLQEKEVQQ